MSAVTVAFTVNGRAVRVSAPPMRRLLDVLRDDLGLTGSKEGCGEGECGACSVILNGELVNSCLIPLVQAEGARIETVEAARESPLGEVVQRSFIAHGGAQCGICTPGMIVTAWWLLQNRERLPDGAAGAGGAPALRELMSGNLCRCTGYELILKAVEAALEETGGGAA